MKKGKKLPVVISISVVLAIVIAAVVMGVVVIKPLDNFGKDYAYVQFYNLNTNYPSIVTPEATKKVEEGLETTKFSVLHALLEGTADFSPRLLKNKDDEIVYRSSTELKNMQATEERYLLRFRYDEIKEIKVEKTTIKYDSIYMLVQEGKGEIVDVRVIPFLLERLDNEAEGDLSSETYKTPELKVKMYTAKLYSAIKDALAMIG